MAGFDGFDAHFLFGPEDGVLVRALFTAGRRRARLLGVRWRSEIKDEGYAYVCLDGNGFRLDMLIERLRRDLPTFAEGVSSGGRSPEHRRRLANGMVDVVGRYRGGLYERYGEDHVPRLRGVRRPVGPPMYDLFPRRHEDLWPRLEVTLDVLASWTMDEIAPEVALEELHTAFELLLTRAAGKRRAPAFAELVDLANARGWLGDAYTMPGIAEHYWKDPMDVMSERDLLLSLKDQRKAAKHQGDAGAGVWLTAHFGAATALLERLSYRMP